MFNNTVISSLHDFRSSVEINSVAQNHYEINITIVHMMCALFSKLPQAIQYLCVRKIFLSHYSLKIVISAHALLGKFMGEAAIPNS